MAYLMRAAAIAVVLIAVGFILAPPLGRELILIALLLAIIAAIFLAIGARIRRNRSSPAPWAAALVGGAAITVPLLVAKSGSAVSFRVFFGLILWLLFAAILAPVFLGARRVSASVPWMVSLVVSAVITVPQLVTEHFKRVGPHVAWGVVWWLLFAAFLRLIIFLADYFRNRHNRLGAKTQAAAPLSGEKW